MATASRRQQRRQGVVDTAARIFYEKGYTSTSIRDLAESLGMLKGSLYYYIDSKESLLFDVLQGLHREALGRIEAAVDAETETAAKLRAFVVALVTFSAENLVRIGVYFRDFRSLSPERQAAIIDERDRYDRLLRALIAQGQEDGVVSPDLDPKLTALAVLGAVNWIHQWYHPGAGLDPAALANEYADFVVAGCLHAPTSPASRGYVASAFS
jgi:TetR/AcrR family transcriptional regulator, cholesterol catabolism regulator